MYACTVWCMYLCRVYVLSPFTATLSLEKALFIKMIIVIIIIKSSLSSQVGTCNPVWYWVCMFAQEVLVKSLGVTLAKQFCDLLLQNSLHCPRYVLTVRHCKQTQILVHSCAFVLYDERIGTFMYLLWRIAPNTGGAKDDRGPVSKLSSTIATSTGTSLQTQTHITSFKSQILECYESLCWVHQYGHLSWGRSQKPAGASLFYSLLNSSEESGT